MTTFPLPTLAATITPAGISAPSYSDIYTSLQASFQSIYGSDSYIDPDSQDGQMLAVFAQAISDANNACIAVFNSFSPSTAQGAGLSSVVKINGLQRLIPTNSQVDLTITGIAGTTITNGIAVDTNNNQWLLPATVIIDASGAITATATAANPGSITAAPGSIISIGTPTVGWQTVTNNAAAAIGAPVESDAALRVRQSISTENPALSVLAAIVGAIADLIGVIQLKVFENDTNFTDNNGIPAHSIAAVVEGGDATQIAQTIERKKSPGCGTFGSTTIEVEDSTGLPIDISFFVPTQVPITVYVTVKALPGYTSSTGTLIVQNIVNFITALGINANDGLLSISALYAPAYDTGFGKTYNITNLQISRSPAVPASTDLAIAFNELPVITTGDVTLNVT